MPVCGACKRPVQGSLPPDEYTIEAPVMSQFDKALTQRRRVRREIRYSAVSAPLRENELRHYRSPAIASSDLHRETSMRQHFILCGLGRIGWRVLEQLRAAGADVAVVDNRACADDPRLEGA